VIQLTHFHLLFCLFCCVLYTFPILLCFCFIFSLLVLNKFRINVIEKSLRKEVSVDSSPLR
jgi:hypothetical protein